MKPLPEGTPWPSGDYIDLATLAISEEELFARLGLQSLRGVEAGLGPWVAVGGVLPSGAFVEFIRYAYAPDPHVGLRGD